MTTRPTRGGARPGAGRKPLDADDPSEPYTIRLPGSWARLLRERDLADKVRAAIKRLVRRHLPK